MTMQTIDHATLTRLIGTGAVQAARAVGQSGGWAVQVQYGTLQGQLAAQRSGQVRLFKKLETLVAYLKGLGLVSFVVDAEKFELPGIPSRPDRAQALKTVHAAAAYDQWFRQQVQSSIDDPRPSVADEDARRLFATKKAALRANAEGAH
jgi:hypothetical protein